MDTGIEPLVGRFQIVREIGRGGMGRVLEARDHELKRPVAIKIIHDPSGAAFTNESVARFAAEAQITAQLQHPNIVPVHEVGRTESGGVYFVMRLVRGRSLAEILEGLRARDPEIEGDWTRPRLLNSFVQACNGVAYAHSRAVLHRDLKPANIMLGDFGEVLVMDWGVARVLSRGPAGPTSSGTYSTSLLLTQDGSTVGTPGYISPEQARGDELDQRSDVWSLGAILYELLAYLPAYDGRDADAVLEASVAGLPPSPQARAPELEIEKEIADIALRALSPRVERRYRNAAHLGQVVRGFLEGSRRRDRARLSITEAESAWKAWRGLVRQGAETRDRAARLERELAPWEPLRRKAELLGAREQLEQLLLERTRAFGALVRAAEQALAQHPGNDAARELLARAYLARFSEAEEAGSVVEALYFHERVRAYDDGRYAAELDGIGSITLRTEPPGAEVTCERLEQTRLRWRAQETTRLGATPLLWTPLAMGSYVLTLSVPDRPPVRYPVHITRRHHWDGGDVPVRVPLASDIGEDCVYVPPGPFLVGGDDDADAPLGRRIAQVEGFAMQVLPVTREAYRGFLDSLPTDRAAARRPRGADWEPRQRPGREPLFDGDLPAAGISWHDAVAYARWLADRDGLPWELPKELWWEKAARGVDGRLFPWGNRFDPTLAKTRDGRPGAAHPEPVGAFPEDISVYGVRDMAGSIREWCGDSMFDGDPQRRAVRGGSWLGGPRECRCANRWGTEPDRTFGSVGFRLARRI